MEPNSDNKRIAKNTMMLYFRMLLTMLVSLYTVRVVLKTLGIVDYGLYNVVGGLVSMFGFLSLTMISASQRFFAYELGRNNITQLKKTFSTIVLIYAIIAVIVFVLAETVGLWFVNAKMVIPADRMNAAMWVYHFSILSFIVTILNIPYSSIIISHENMQAYASISIAEVLVKLGIVYLLTLFAFDKLKLYAILIFLATCLSTLIYRLICNRKYEESHFIFTFDKPLFKTILSYSGWNLFGAISGVLNTQGINILLNLFFGPALNAARAIADQVNVAITSFSQNFYMAVNPQIIKSYAANDTRRMFSLVFASTKFAFFLFLLLSIPLYLEMDFVLSLWLSQVNEYMIVFTRLILIYSLINIIESPLTQAARATGRIRNYQILVGIVTLLTVPVSYLLFKLGYPPETTFIVLVVVYFVAFFIRLGVLKSLVDFPVRDYMHHVFFIIMGITILASIIPGFIYFYVPDGILRFFLIILSSTISMLSMVFLFGLNKNEKNLLFGYIKKVILKYK
jgi:O-antigen/teichoic acid export membrane protein